MQQLAILGLARHRASEQLSEFKNVNPYLRPFRLLDGRIQPLIRTNLVLFWCLKNEEGRYTSPERGYQMTALGRVALNTNQIQRDLKRQVMRDRLLHHFHPNPLRLLPFHFMTPFRDETDQE